MKKDIRSEDSYIAHDIIPMLTEYGYPGIGESDKVRIKEVPWYRPSGGIGGHIDIVYYHQGKPEGEPVLLVEAKKEHKRHESALKEAKDYIRNFPIDKKEFAPSGKAPMFIATTVGKDIRFYKHRYDVSTGQLVQVADPITGIVTFQRLLEEYGLVKELVPRLLSHVEFIWFLGELLDVYNVNKSKVITRHVILNVARQILSFLEDPINYTSRIPYTLLDREKFRQARIRDLFRRFDISASLTSKNAREFRKFVLRAFQGSRFLNQYMTEECVILFMLNLVGLQRDWKVLDFECGSGGFLVKAVDKGNIPLENTLGIDIDELPFTIAKTYFAIYFGITDKQNLDALPIKKDNGLFFWGNNWDLVISNPAGSDKYPEEKRKDIEKVLDNLEKDLDLNGRPDSFSEYNFSVQQAVRSAKVGGKICVILPEGFFSNSQDDILRKYVAKHSKVLAIISLPRGVFKVGTEVRQEQRGRRTASMKMSILYARKIREVKDGEGLNLSNCDLNYPVFIANVSPPESTRGEIENWLGPRLDITLRQWKSWQENRVLAELGEIKIERLKKAPAKKQGKKEKQKLLFDIPTERHRWPRYKRKISAKTKIKKELKNIFKKKKQF